MRLIISNNTNSFIQATYFDLCAGGGGGGGLNNIHDCQISSKNQLKGFFNIVMYGNHSRITLYVIDAFANFNRRITGRLYFVIKG